MVSLEAARSFLAEWPPNLLAVDGDRLWGPDPQADFVAADIDDGDFNVVTKHDGFIAMSRQYEHSVLMVLVRGWRNWRWTPTIRQQLCGPRLYSGFEFHNDVTRGPTLFGKMNCMPVVRRFQPQGP